MAASAFDQAQSIAQRYQQAQTQMAQQANNAAQQMNQPFQGQRTGSPFPVRTKAPGIFEHMQNPHVQNAMAVIGKFLTDINHPLAGHFVGQGGNVLGGVSPQARLTPVGQSTNQGMGGGIMNMYAQGGTGQVPKTGGYAAPGATIPGVPRK